MNVLDEIQVWAMKGFFVEYYVVDQIEKGYKESVERGEMPEITYTVSIRDKETDVIIFDGSFDYLKEGFDKAFGYLVSRYSDSL